MFEVLKVDKEVSLRPARVADASSIFDLTERNRAFLHPWMSWVDGTHKVADTEAFLKSCPMKSIFDHQFPVMIEYRGKLAGMTGYNNGREEHFSVDIGYWIDESLQGRGIVTRALFALVDHAFREYEVNRVCLIILENNIPSIRLAEKSGFRAEGLMRDYFCRKGEFSNAWLYSYLKRDHENALHSLR